MVVATIFSHSVGVEIMQDSKALRRLCGQRGAEALEEGKYMPSYLFLGFLETIFNGEGEIHFQHK